MTKIIDWLKTIAFALNDDEPGHEFTRYPIDKMLAAYNDALCLVYKHRPDLFTEWTVARLTPGKYQDVRGCCDQVLVVADQVTAQGGVIKELTGTRNTTTTTKRHWRKPSCLVHPDADGGYAISNIDIDGNMNGRFTVDPPVPPGLDVYVRLKCVQPPCPVNVAQVNDGFDAACDMNAAAWHFVLARMLTGDRFSQAANRDMDFHYKMFYQILGIVQKQEDWIESEKEATS